MCELQTRALTTSTTGGSPWHPLGGSTETPSWARWVIRYPLRACRVRSPMLLGPRRFPPIRPAPPSSGNGQRLLTTRCQPSLTFNNHRSCDYNSCNVKTVDDNHSCQYKDHEYAGTPEGWQNHCYAGANCDGESNHTGNTAIREPHLQARTHLRAILQSPHRPPPCGQTCSSHTH